MPSANNLHPLPPQPDGAGSGGLIIKPESLELSDEVLVARVVECDVAAFTMLYDRYARPVYVVAVYMLGSAEAEEAVQELFLRLWRKADQFDPSRGSFNNWFMAISRHYLRDQLRRRSLQQQVMAAEQIDQLLTEAVDPNVDVEQEVWQRQRGAALLNALKSLPAEQRQAITLAYFGGFSQSSIAERLGWPLGTVKKRVRLGLQKLRAFLGQSEPSSETSAEPVPPVERRNP
ncbi:MAG: RNA polymerase subunit sigma-70 [Anaerolineae bacterium]|nr:RNA polymerase subunit sigma-70 [Anaerolineae bacterium]